MRAKGRIPDDYAEREYGAESLAELMDFIESGNPDPERLKAVKAMFFALNDSKNVLPNSKMIAFHFMRITREMTATQIVLLARIREAIRQNPDNINSSPEYLAHHSMKPYIETLAKLDLRALEAKHLLKLDVPKNKDLMTDLGEAYCNWLEEYSDQSANREASGANWETTRREVEQSERRAKAARTATENGGSSSS
jgi:hypothetical protein